MHQSIIFDRGQHAQELFLCLYRKSTPILTALTPDRLGASKRLYSQNSITFGEYIHQIVRLFIKPEKERFTLIYRTATEDHWDNNGLFLYSPKPREWTYFDWFRQITGVTETECSCKLILTDETKWTNISNELKRQIIEHQKATA